jgi:hypothetical protein
MSERTYTQGVGKELGKLSRASPSHHNKGKKKFIQTNARKWAFSELN